jgi:hypothetical protein
MIGGSCAVPNRYGRTQGAANTTKSLDKDRTVILYFLCRVIPPQGASNTSGPHKIDPDLRSVDTPVGSQDRVVGSPTTVKDLSNSTSDIIAERELY